MGRTTFHFILNCSSLHTALGEIVMDRKRETSNMDSPQRRVLVR